MTEVFAGSQMQLDLSQSETQEEHSHCPAVEWAQAQVRKRDYLGIQKQESPHHSLPQLTSTILSEHCLSLCCIPMIKNKEKRFVKLKDLEGQSLRLGSPNVW
jgi:hypothetical protein